MHSKTIPSAEKKCMESREETLQPSHVVCLMGNVDNYVVNHKANYMVKICGRSRESHTVPSSAGVVL